jgi:hypothetical protein
MSYSYIRLVISRNCVFDSRTISGCHVLLRMYSTAGKLNLTSRPRFSLGIIKLNYPTIPIIRLNYPTIPIIRLNYPTIPIIRLNYPTIPTISPFSCHNLNIHTYVNSSAIFYLHIVNKSCGGIIQPYNSPLTTIPYYELLHIIFYCQGAIYMIGTRLIYYM